MEFKSHIVKKAIETDETTYVRVLADQVCEMPIIPKKYPIRQLDWKVSLSKGVIYLPDDGIYCRILDIGYGAWINCSVFGRENITIESGEGNKGCTLINGSVISDGKISVIYPQSKDEDYKEGFLIVKGNIVGKDIEISAPTIVFGNVIAEESITINDYTLISGGLASKKISAQNLTCNFISGENLELKDLVSVLTPAIIGKDIKFEKIRVVTIICKKCSEENDFDMFSCNFKDCDKCLTMSQDDIMELEGLKFVTPAWRIFREDEENFSWLKDYLYKVYYERIKPIEFNKLKYAGIHKDPADIGLKVEVKPKMMSSK